MDSNADNSDKNDGGRRANSAKLVQFVRSLEADLWHEINEKTDQQIEAATKADEEIKVVNKGGMRCKRRFEKIINQKLQELSTAWDEGKLQKESEQKFEERMKQAGSTVVKEEEKKEIFDDCMDESFRGWVQRII